VSKPQLAQVIAATAPAAPAPTTKNFVVASDFSLFQCPLRSAKTANHDLKTLKMLFKIKSAPSRIEKGIS
jgi:hypothetical protein